MLTWQDPHLPAHIKETDEYRIIRAYSFPTLRQKAILASMWVFPVMFGLIACFPDKVSIMASSTAFY